MRPDARLAVLLSMVAGFCVWRYSPVVLAALLFALAWLMARQPSFPGLGRPILRPVLRFALFFGLLKLCLDMLNPDIGAGQAAVNAAMLTGRLLSAVCIGLALLLLCGPRGLCLALTWYLRPMLRNNAWKVGLAAALTIHFLPMVFLLVSQTSSQIRLRLPHLGPLRRMALLGQSTLRQSAQKSWKQSVALLARDVNKPEAWVLRGLPALRPALATLAASAVCIGLLYV